MFMRQEKWLCLAVLSQLLLGCNGSWNNWFQTESVTPKILVAPTSAKQLVEGIAKGSARGMRIRMTGNGHSLSDVAITDEILLTPAGLNQPLNLDCKRLRGGCDASLVRVQSGIKIADLNNYLDQHGRALWNMGGYDGQTLAGVIMTATHGSGLAYGPIADTVASLQMVVDGGHMVQIEPKDGITDPSLFPGFLEDDANVPVQLIQDDEAFNAARVSIGSMGVVYAITIRTDQKFWLKEVRHRIQWSELKKPGGYLDRAMHGLPIYGDDKPSPEHFELQYSPYTNDQGDHTFLITDRYRSYTPLPEQSASHRGERGANFESGLISLFGAPLAVIMDIFPKLSKTVLESALKSEEAPSYTNVSYKVFNIGVINDTPVLGIEMAFDINQTIAAVERSFSVAEELLAKGIPQTSPIAIRFVKQTSALIGMSHDQNESFMEIIVLRDGKNAKNLLVEHQKTYLAEFNSRPHWGLDMNLLTSESQLRKLYPNSWERWKTQFHRFNANGTFDGKITDRLGISVRPKAQVPQPAVLAESVDAKLMIAPLSNEERAASISQRHAVMPLFLKHADSHIAQLQKEIQESTGTELEQKKLELQKMQETKALVLQRNADLTE